MMRPESTSHDKSTNEEANLSGREFAVCKGFLVPKSSFQTARTSEVNGFSGSDSEESK